MRPQEYYRLTGPTELAGPPEWYSPTSLAALSTCPRRWQLENSQWGDLPRHPGSPNRKRIEGSIVHQLLEAMFRQLGRHGRPARGSDEFRTAMRELGVRAVLAELIASAETRWAEHPRTMGAPLSLDPGDLRNRVFRLFREGYKPSSKSRSPKAGSGGPALGAEVWVEDEALRLRGKVDLARPEELVEFKTGAPAESHVRQMELYAVVWRRQRGVLPRLTVVYPDALKQWTPTSGRLEEVEHELGKEIEAFDRELAGAACAETGEHCGFCGVRAFCADYWKQPLPTDVELVVSEMPSAQCVGDRETTVLLRGGHAAVSKVEVGERLRCLGVRAGEDALELAPWGEVFVTPADSGAESTAEKES